MSFFKGYYEQSDSQVTTDVYHHSVEMANAAHHIDKREEDELELIEHSLPLDVDKLNKERIEQDCNLWDALESSKWLPCDALEVS